jgi:perosamine synthetase
MPIFNSLGSNYTFSFVLQSLLANNDTNHEVKLKNFLEKKYQGEAILLYKGREALRLALQIINQKDAVVAICGYTCFAVYDPIVKENYDVEYLDIEKETFHFSFDTIKNHVEKNKKIKVLIVQNTLGYPCEIEKIAAYCKEKNIILIEDLAHAIGTVYDNGKEAGTLGDFTFLSFSQDKMIDGISGGALIVRNAKFKLKSSEEKLSEISFNKQLIDRSYPLFTFLIRKTYGFGFGKVLHKLLRTFKLLSNPMSDAGEIHTLASWYSSLILKEFENLEENLSHRRKIASVYTEKLNKGIVSEFVKQNILLSTNLRFPIIVEGRERLIKYLKQNGVFVSDIWYDSPVAPKKYQRLSNYDHQCPDAEQVSEHMLNLPTHRNISEKDAERITKKINQWLQWK